MAKKENIQVKVPANLPVKVIAAPDAVTTEQRERGANLGQKVMAAPDVVITGYATVAKLGLNIPPAPDFNVVNRPERDPDLNVSVSAAPDTEGAMPIGTPLLVMGLRGGAITVKEKALLPNGAFSMIQDMRGRHPGFEQRKGQRKLHTTPDSTNKVLSIYQFNKTRVTESHFFAQFSDGDILEATAAPPGVTSDVFGGEIYDGGVSQIPASWGDIDEKLIHSNGVDQHQIYGGTLSPVDKFVIYKGTGAPPDMPTVGEDFSVEISDGRSSSQFFTTAEDRILTAGTSNWTNSGGGTAYATFDKTGDLSLLADATGDYCSITFTNIGTALKSGHRYRFTYDYSETEAGFEFKLTGATGQTLGDAVDGTRKTIDFTAVEDYATTDTLQIMAKTSATAQGDFDNFSLFELPCTVAVLDSLDLYSENECVFICTPMPVDTLTWTISLPNGTASTATLYYRKNDLTWEPTSMTDNTKTGGDTTLGKTGTMVWTLPTDEMSCYMYGVSGFWYQLRLTVSALDAEVEVSAVTYATDFQDLRNIWDGVPVDAGEVQVEGTAEYARYAAGSVNLSELAAGKKTYVASADPLEGIYIDPGDTPNTNATMEIDTIKYWDGDSFESVVTVTDGTNGLVNPGWLTFKRKTAYKRQFGTSTFYAYWYEIVWKTAAISSSVVVYIRTMPYFNIDEFGPAGMTNAIWKGRAIYSFNLYPEYLYISRVGKPMVLNGQDFKVKEAGDGRSNKIVAMRKFYNELMVWQEEKGVEGGCLTLFVGSSPTTLGKLLLSTTLGTFSNKSVVIVDGVATTREVDEKPKTLAFYISSRGVCMSAGQEPTIMSDDIQNYFDPQQSECIRTGYEKEHWIGYDSAENVLRLGLVSGGSATVPNVFPIYDLVDKVWYFDDPKQELSCMTEVQAGSGDVSVIQVGGGVDDGTVYQLNYGTNDVTTEIDAYIRMELDAQGYELFLSEILMRMKVQDAGNVIITPYLNDVAQSAITKAMTAAIITVRSSGTTTATTTDKLVHSGAAFDTDGTTVGDTVRNLTDSTTASVSAIDGSNTLSIDSDIMVSGDDYSILASNEVIRQHRFNTNLTNNHISLKFQNATASQSLYIESLALDLAVLRNR